MAGRVTRFFLLTLLLLGGFLCAPPLRAEVPELPKLLIGEAVSEEAKFILLDFFSPYCGGCQQMEPYLKLLRHKHAGKVHFQRIDITESVYAPYAELFSVDSTPTYILFDKAGKPLYRMSHFISFGVLQAQLGRFTGDMPKQAFPDIQAFREKAKNGRFKLVAFHPESCGLGCEEADALLAAMGYAFDEVFDHADLDIITVASEEREVQEFIKALDLQDQRAYVLFDPEGHALFKQEGTFDKTAMWQYLKALTDPNL